MDSVIQELIIEAGEILWSGLVKAYHESLPESLRPTHTFIPPCDCPQSYLEGAVLCADCAEKYKFCRHCQNRITLLTKNCIHCGSVQFCNQGQPLRPIPRPIHIRPPFLQADVERIHLIGMHIAVPNYIPDSLPTHHSVDEINLVAHAFNLRLNSAEKQHLNLFNKGYSHAEIAQLYQVHEGRVRQWEEELCQRFLTTDKVEMLSLARQAGFIKKSKSGEI